MASAEGRQLYSVSKARKLSKNSRPLQVAISPPAPALTPTATAPRDPNALTPRELEVLHLLVQRMSDAEIAEKLVISRRTASTHLTAIYGKLGVNSRRAAMRYALDHKLV